MAFSKALARPLREALRDMVSTDNLTRARALGFDGPFYHGTNRHFDEFKPSKSGALGPGVYVARKPETADVYAGISSIVRDWTNGVVYPLMVRAKLAPEHALNSAITQIERRYGSKIHDGELYDRAIELLKARGYGGVRAEGFDFHSVWNPADIRSVFAKFDPDNLSSRDLLAGGAGGLVSAELLRRALAAKMDGESSAA